MGEVGTVKLEDIARELDLSVSTVSRAINGKGRVGEGTRARVLDAVRRSDYRINDVARALRMKTARSIGVIVPDISNGFFASVIKGAQQRCHQSDYILIVCNSDEDAAVEGEVLQTLLSKQVSGLVLASVGESRVIRRKYGALNVPIVYIDNMPRDAEGYDSVSIDNCAAARQLTLAMLDRGYHDIGMISGPMAQSTGELRRRGFEAALAEQGVEARSEWIREGLFTMESGYAQMQRILDGDPIPRAMLFASNYIAYGALKAIREAGLRVPDDIAIAAFDALDDTGLITPLITSINQPAQQIGQCAVDILLEHMDKRRDAGKRLVLTPSFVDGDSW